MIADCGGESNRASEIRNPASCFRLRAPRYAVAGFILSQRSRTKPGGAERDRTVDLLNAIQALSQLSYGPTGTVFVTNGGVCVKRTVVSPSMKKGPKAGKNDRHAEPAGGSSIEHRASRIAWVGGWNARIAVARKRMGPGGFRGLQIRWAGLSRVGRRVRFPCASATRPGWRMRARLVFSILRVEVDVERRIRLQE